MSQGTFTHAHIDAHMHTSMHIRTYTHAYACMQVTADPRHAGVSFTVYQQKVRTESVKPACACI